MLIMAEQQFKTPTELFNDLQEKKQKATSDKLYNLYLNALILADKYKKTGQKKGAAKLDFYIKNYEREKKLLDVGINTFVYRSDIEYYIRKVTTDRVSIIELEYYPREIPDEIVKAITAYKDLFDQLYIVFTDYTEELENEVEKERKKETDPILFGAFKDASTDTVAERFYFLGDWEDEYCDLTLDRMVNEINEKRQAKINHLIAAPEELEDIKNDLEKLKAVEKEKILSNTPITITGQNIISGASTTPQANITYIYPGQKFKTKQHFFSKVRAFFSRKENEK